MGSASGAIQLLMATLLALLSAPQYGRARRVVIEVPFHIRSHEHVHTVFRALPAHPHPHPHPHPTAAQPPAAHAAMSFVPVHVPAAGSPPNIAAVAFLAGVPSQQILRSRPAEARLPQLPGQHEAKHQQLGVSFQRSEQRSHLYR